MYAKFSSHLTLQYEKYVHFGSYLHTSNLTGLLIKYCTQTHTTIPFENTYFYVGIKNELAQGAALLIKECQDYVKV